MKYAFIANNFHGSITKMVAQRENPPKALACLLRGTAKSKMYNFEISQGIIEGKKKGARNPERKKKKE
jgi:hypothetical protein